MVRCMCVWNGYFLLPYVNPVKFPIYTMPERPGDAGNIFLKKKKKVMLGVLVSTCGSTSNLGD